MLGEFLDVWFIFEGLIKGFMFEIFLFFFCFNGVFVFVIFVSLLFLFFECLISWMVWLLFWLELWFGVLLCSESWFGVCLLLLIFGGVYGMRWILDLVVFFDFDCLWSGVDGGLCWLLGVDMVLECWVRWLVCGVGRFLICWVWL